jgi:two-component system chemotaxis sensor kinase CheA
MSFDMDMSQFQQVFFEESAEHLASMESILLAMDIDNPNPEDMNALFRAAHSIKGSSATFGFPDMTAVTHDLETLLDRVRKNEIPLTTAIVDASLEARDILNLQLQAHQGGEAVDPDAVIAICAKVKALTGQPIDEKGGKRTTASKKEIVEPDAPADSPTGEPVVYQITVPFKADDPKKKLGPEVLKYLRTLGELEVLGRDEERASLRLKSTSSVEQIREAFSFHPSADLVIVEAEGGVKPVKSKKPRKKQEGATAAIRETGAENSPPPQPQTIIEGPVQAVQVPAEKSETAPAAKAGQKTPAPAVAQAAESSIRVSVDKVDLLINLVGELVITQSMLSQTATAEHLVSEHLYDRLLQLERNTRELQETVMSIRMLPVSFAFNRFPRLVRDLAGKLGKQVDLKMIGAETELDRGVIEKIADPLNHLIRNSIDHGLEMPDERMAAGKDAKGVVTLSAFHQGGSVVIMVQDDGKGLNRERILAKAKEKNIPVSDNMPDAEVWPLIFAPGFSTAAVVTDVSGRGVGMDVVKKNIESLGGRVEISSEAGKGSTITIRLPLTLAIMDGMSIGVGDQVYIVPITAIAESIRPSLKEIKTIVGQGRVVNVRGEYLPLVAVHEIFNIRSRSASFEEGILMIVETDHGRVALFVDELLGQHQVVIKNIESNYRKVQGISAATIMGDGSVSMILDVSEMARLGKLGAGMQRAA